MTVSQTLIAITVPALLTMAQLPPPLTVHSKDGTSIAYRKVGAGPPMLLVHGSASIGLSWGAVLPALSQHFTVYFMDRRGRAPSGDAESYSIDAEVDDINAVLDAIAQPTILVGHSYGALVALRGAAGNRLNNVTRLILYEPPVYLTQEPDKLKTREEIKAAWAAGDRERVTELFIGMTIGQEALKAVKASTAWTAMTGLANTFSRESDEASKFKVTKEELARWKTPTTMLLGSQSPAFMKEGTAFVCGAIPGCKVVTLEGESHMAVSRAPAMFVEKVLDATK